MNYSLKIKVREWFDKKAKCWLIYSKKYEITGYGKTKKKSRKMFDTMLNNILYDSLPNHLK